MQKPLGFFRAKTFRVATAPERQRSARLEESLLVNPTAHTTVHRARFQEKRKATGTPQNSSLTTGDSRRSSLARLFLSLRSLRPPLPSPLPTTLPPPKDVHHHAPPRHPRQLVHHRPRRPAPRPGPRAVRKVPRVRRGDRPAPAPQPWVRGPRERAQVRRGRVGVCGWGARGGEGGWDGALLVRLFGTERAWGERRGGGADELWDDSFTFSTWTGKGGL